MQNENNQNLHPAYNTVCTFFRYYLGERNIDKALSMMSENVYSVGTGEHEVALGKEQFRFLITEEIASMPQPLEHTITDFISHQMMPDCWNCFCYVNAVLNASETINVHFRLRVSSIVYKEKDEYLIGGIHASVASTQQEDREYFPLQFITNEIENLNRKTQQELMQIVTQVLPGGIIGGYIEEGYLLYIINEQLLTMSHFTYEQFLEETGGFILNSICEEDREFVVREVTNQLCHNNQYEIEYRMKTGDGGYIWVYDIGRKTITTDNREAIISILIDITERKREEELLKKESMIDSLTGLYNRRAGIELISKYANLQNPYLYIMIDLDNFKLVNDIYGHSSGDDVLRWLATLLSASFRKTDIVYRIGGDEFGIFIPNCSSREVIEAKLQDVTDRYKRMIEHLYPESHSTVSIGGIHSDVPRSHTELYHLADCILYKIKKSQKGHVLIKDK